MRLLLLAAALLILPGVAAAQPTSVTDLANAYRAAFEAKDIQKIDALTYTVGLSDAEKQQADTFLKMMLTGQKVADIQPQPLPADFQLGGIMAGKKYEPTCAPIGLLQVKLNPNPDPKGPAQVSMSLPYAVVDGHYYLVTAKSTDLGWKGPPDHSLSVMAMATSPKGVSLDVKWNASGVDQEKTVGNGSFSTMGQYFEHITATSTDDANTMTLVLLDQNGNDIYRSQPLKGKGTLEYKKP